MPVFMKVWAGSWLMASVFIERMMHNLVGDRAEVGKQLANLLPRLAEPLEAELRREAIQLRPLKLGDRLALGERLRHRLAVEFGQLRLVVEGFQVRRPARLVEPDHPLCLGRKVQRIDHSAAGQRIGIGGEPPRRSSSSDARAIVPSPAEAFPRKARRVQQLPRVSKMFGMLGLV